MATESIGALIPTAIPGYADAADIQAALRAYHYGSYSYSPANTSPGDLVTPSMAKTIYDIQQDIITLENRPSSGGDVANTAPQPGDFTPSGIPNGYIWVDQDGTIGGQPTSATSVFTNTAPTSNLSTGVIWVDQDPTSITNNPFIPTAVIDAKGDLIAGSGNDSAVRLAVASTNGYVLSVNSSTTSGLDWVDSAASTQTLSNKSISLGSNTVTGTTAQFNTALTDGDFATLAGTETLTNKTITSALEVNPILRGPEERWSVSATAATGTISLDVLTSGILYYTSNSTGNWTLNIRGDGSNTLNSILTTNDSITVVFFATNGATPFYQTGFTVDGSAVTPKWQNGTAPSAGNANSIDIYSYTIVKTGNAAFTAFGSQTRFA